MADAFSGAGEAGALTSAWGWISGPLFALFGGGVVWGATRQTIRDHDRRLGEVEKNSRDQIKALSDKVDANHRQVMNALLRRPDPDPNDNGA